MKENKIILLLGFILFFLVLSVIYSGIVIQIVSPSVFNSFQIFAPFVVLSGFFTFLIGAVLVALVVFEFIKRRV